MTDREQASHLGEELDKLIDRFRDEYDISYATVIGALHVKAHLLCMEVAELADDDTEEVDS